MKVDPASTCFQSVPVPIRVGVLITEVVTPSPNCPIFFPQAHSVPSVLMATEWEMPPELPPPTLACPQSLSDPIRVGVFLSMVVPSPSCPFSFPPQAQSDPSGLMATVWENPEATDFQTTEPCPSPPPHETRVRKLKNKTNEIFGVIKMEQASNFR